MKWSGSKRTNYTEQPVVLPTSTSTSPTSSGGAEGTAASTRTKDATTTPSDLEMTQLDLQYQTHGVSLPTPEDFGVTARVEKKAKRRRVQRWLIVAGGILLAVGAIVGSVLAVVFKRKSQTKSNLSPNAPPASAIVAWLEERQVSDATAMTTPGTPQYRAVQWLRTRPDPTLPTIGDLNFDRSRDLAAYKYAAAYALAVLYYSTSGPDYWGHPLDFLLPDAQGNDDICSWTDYSPGIDEGTRTIQPEISGVLCDPVSLIPYTIDIELNNMTGTIPTEMGILTTLQVLDLSYNFLHGTVPTELCQLTNLKALVIGHNNALEGPLLDCLPPSLIHLDMADCALSGPLPTELCALDSLERIFLDNNDFTGELPTCNWPKVSELYLSDNHFEGTLPTQMASLPNLTALFVDGNRLSGNPLTTVIQLYNIQVLYLEDNSFTGSLDGSFGISLLYARVLDFSSNNFTSTTGIPTQLFTLPNLEVLDLSDNQLRGKTIDNIPVHERLRFLSAYRNQLTGTLPSTLTNLVVLVHLDLSYNLLTGDLNTNLFTSIRTLENIFLSENPGFTEGPVPNMDGMVNLREVSFKNTNRVGTLPTFANSSLIHLIDLDNNRLTGTVPENYGRFPNLGFLLLNRNTGLNGTLPTFNEPSILTVVLLDKTSITGNFKSLCSLAYIKGEKEIPEQIGPLVLADCGDDDSAIVCDCCQCCTRDQPVCSNPTVSNLDWTWEHKFNNVDRTFGLNTTLLPTV